MLSKPRFTLTIATVLATLAFSAMWTAPAFADDSAPPPPADPTLKVPPPVDTPVAAPDSSTQPDLLSQVPEGTDVVVVNTSGDAVPLASKDAAQAIVTGDPIWCPTGVAPKPGVGGCSGSFGSLSAVAAGPSHAANGTIWIENGGPAGSEANFDGGGSWSSAANFSLTLQGGWIGGVSGSTAIIGTSLFNSAINIFNWNGAVTVNDISMNGANNVGQPGYGSLYISTTKNISIANVTIVNSTGTFSSGAYLSNTASTTQATVTVKNSSFNNNTTYGGLQVYSRGAVTLTNVNANSNHEFGALIQNDSDSVASSVTVTNSSFNSNSDTNTSAGLEIYSNGAVKLSQVTANSNIGSGVYVDNKTNNVTDLHPQPVTVTGFLTALENGGSGLEIDSKGLVNLTNLTTSYNSSYGTDIDNTYGALPMAVNITGTNSFTNNYYNGLTIVSLGAITLNNITAIFNGTTPDYQGVYIYNNYDTSKPQSITLTGNNFFLYNGFNGLEAWSYGAITTNNITAAYNGTYTSDGAGSGVYLNNSGALTTKPASITLNGINSFTSNDYAGLEAYSAGVITLNNATASNNSVGVYVDNRPGTSAGVILNGNNAFNQNGGTGLTIYSHGVITVNNVTASENGSGGAYLDNHGAVLPVAVMLKGNNTFNHNHGTGLTVLSEGAITANNVTASDSTNGSDGAYLDNGYGTSAAVLLTGNNTFNKNQSSGLEIYSKGVITVNNITAFLNNNEGAHLNNQYGTAQNGIFVNGYGLFQWNTSNGLAAYSNGAITTNNLNANYNFDNGAYLYTIGISKPQTVTLKGTNNFNYNGNSGAESGLYVKADGTITVNNVTASYNYNDGAYLDNFTNWDSPVVNFAAFGSVVITGFGNFTGNGNAGATDSFVSSEGLFVYTHGAVTLNYVASNFNTLNDGIGIRADGNVTLVCSSANNNAYGLYMYYTPNAINPNILTLKGFIAAGNTVTNENLLYAHLVRTHCP